MDWSEINSTTCGHQASGPQTTGLYTKAVSGLGICWACGLIINQMGQLTISTEASAQRNSKLPV
eukprot:scaffold484384_cov21-Prasinocladus_malaysianus.AAC.2